MDDLISRQAAIDGIQKAYVDTECGEDKYAVWKNVGLTNALHIMQDLPSAQPMRKRGKWLDADMNYGTCSECDFFGFTTNYCPLCGCQMMEDRE